MTLSLQHFSSSSISLQGFKVIWLSRVVTKIPHSRHPAQEIRLFWEGKYMTVHGQLQLLRPPMTLCRPLLTEQCKAFPASQSNGPSRRRKSRLLSGTVSSLISEPEASSSDPILPYFLLACVCIEGPANFEAQLAMAVLPAGREVCSFLKRLKVHMINSGGICTPFTILISYVSFEL